MASDGDDSPRRNEKRSKTNQDRAVASASRLMRTKATCAHDAGSVHGHGHSAHASASSALADPPQWNPIGAQRWEFVPGIGRIPATDPAEATLDAEGRTIAPDVCPRTPSRCIAHYNEGQLVPFEGDPPKIREPQNTPNEAGGYTPHLQIDYTHRLGELRNYHARNLYEEEGKDLRLEYHFLHHFHFDFYHFLAYRR